MQAKILGKVSNIYHNPEAKTVSISVTDLHTGGNIRFTVPDDKPAGVAVEGTYTIECRMNVRPAANGASYLTPIEPTFKAVEIKLPEFGG